MNRKLMEAIIEHILSNLAVIPSEFVNLDKSKSLMEKEYLLSSRIKFEGDINPAGHVWGCQLSADSQEVKILLGDCSQDEIVKEYCLLIQLKDAPTYGLYLVSSYERELDSEPMIACSLNGKEWLECNTFLQASFLAGMEQIKEIGYSWDKCKSHKEEFEKMLSFIQFHQLVYGANDEG